MSARSARALRRPARARGGRQVLHDGSPTGQRGIGSHDQRCREDLQDGQQGGCGQVESMGSLPVDLCLDRGDARAAQHEDDTEAREAEGEHQERRGRDRGQEQARCHAQEGGSPARAQHPRGLAQPGVEVGPRPSHHAHHDGRVVERVRQHNAGKGAHEHDADSPVRQSTGPEQGDECRPDDHRGKDKGDGEQCPHELLAGEVVAREDVCSGQPESQGEQGRERCLGCARGQEAGRIDLAHQPRETLDARASQGCESHTKDPREGIQEEHCKVDDGQRAGRGGKRAARGLRCLT